MFRALLASLFVLVLVSGPAWAQEHHSPAEARPDTAAASCTAGADCTPAPEAPSGAADSAPSPDRQVEPTEPTESATPAGPAAVAAPPLVAPPSAVVSPPTTLERDMARVAVAEVEAAPAAPVDDLPSHWPPAVAIGLGIASSLVGLGLGVLPTLNCDGTCQPSGLAGGFVVGGVTVITAGYVWLEWVNEEHREHEIKHRLEAPKPLGAFPGLSGTF